MTDNIRLFKIRYHFPVESIHDIREETEKELEKFSDLIHPGARIAVGVGSRGIKNLMIIVKETIRFLRSKGAEPFIVPAMGSHGGATAEGQEAILKDYGITGENIGAPVKSSMDVVSINGWEGPNELFMDKLAWESDGVFLINKVKPHSDFRSKYESGLVKMAVIGLGKQKGAEAIHKFGVFGLSELLEGSIKHIFSTGKILGGLAIVENALDDTMLIKALKADQILQDEPQLLQIAKQNRPYFPVNQFDVLIIDRMGKNISGVGIDTNIIGRMKIHGQKEPDIPHIKSILVTDLTAESHGNATGVGLADVITRRLYDKIDQDITRTNIITSSFLERGKIPITAGTDQEGFQYALRSCGYIDPGKERIIRIQDTLHMNEMYVSEAIREEIQSDPRVEILDSDVDIFDPDGKLLDF